MTNEIPTMGPIQGFGTEENSTSFFEKWKLWMSVGGFGIIFVVFVIVLIYGVLSKKEKHIDFILELLQSEVGTIESIEVATEQTDINNLLNKQGGYIELGWFTDSRIEKGNETIGVDSGGAIEKFKTETEAGDRNKYLTNFDGTLLSSGYHEQHGVFVIRVSNKLTATQQKEIVESIKKIIRQ